MSTIAPQRTARLDIRLRERERGVLVEAARLSGRYMAELVRDASLAEARRVLGLTRPTADPESTDG